MSNWQTPITTWGQAGQTSPGVDDFNRMEGNIGILGKYDRAPGYGTATGTNAKSITLNPAPGSYYDGLCFAFKNATQNTGAVTINVNGMGAKSIKKPNGNDLVPGNLKAGSVYTVRYNGTNFILQGSDSAGNATPEHVLAGKTFSNDNDTGITGTMPNQGAKIITPSTVNQVIAEGYHNGLGYVKGDVNLKAENILDGVSIFGVTGTLLKGRATASGTLTFTTTISNRITKIFLPDFNFYPWLIITHDTVSTRCFLGSFYGADPPMPDDFFNNVPRTTGYNVRFFRLLIGSGVYYPDDGYLSKTGSYINFYNHYYNDGEKEGTLKWVVIG